MEVRSFNGKIIDQFMQELCREIIFDSKFFRETRFFYWEFGPPAHWPALLFESGTGVTKKCTLPLHTLIFVCSTFRYTFYTLHTFYTFTHFSQIYTRARSRDHVEAQFTHLHAQFTHIYTFTHFTRPMDQKFFRIWFSDWWKKIIKKFFVLICIIIKFFNL